MCLCMKKAVFPGKEDQENRQLLRRTPKPADEIIKSEGNVVPGKGLATN